MSRLPFECVCTAEIAAVRAEPDERAEQVTQVLRGEALAVEERRNGWVRVRTAYDYGGWLRETNVLGDALAEARSLIGTPYEWGGLSERGIDCSGLVHLAFRRAGRLVPRDAWQQEAAGRPVAADELRPGDFVTYGDADRADHIAFWLGDGRILHSASRAGGVVEEAEPGELKARRRRLIRL
jgi:cell wall-associated NlpC family hydrolase